MDQPQIPASGFQDPDVYEHITLCWVLVPEAVKIHLLLDLISRLTPEQRQDLREACEDFEDWGTPWE
jgi:hypothetical protein